MPDKRAHRGPHPEDAVKFAEPAWADLRQAVADLSWLLDRGYAEKSALKLVGDHFSLTERQRTGVMRCSCSNASLERRRRHQVTRGEVRGQALLVDGYNVLTTVEAALARGVIIEGRDGCYRDMASMHGTFRKVEETAPALQLVGETLAELSIHRCLWYLDSPVSNSGRLKQVILQIAAQRGWDWQVEVVQSPDAVLAKADEIIATADSIILDRCRQWFNLAREVLATRLPDVPVVNLSERV